MSSFKWQPPEIIHLTVEDIAEAITSNNPECKERVRQALDKMEWMSYIIRLESPSGDLITPVEINGEWTSLQFQVVAE